MTPESGEALLRRGARQVTRANTYEVARWVNQRGGHASFDALSAGVVVQAPAFDQRGDMQANPGDWVILRNGDFSVWSAA